MSDISEHIAEDKLSKQATPQDTMVRIIAFSNSLVSRSLSPA